MLPIVRIYCQAIQCHEIACIFFKSLHNNNKKDLGELNRVLIIISLSESHVFHFLFFHIKSKIVEKNTTTHPWEIIQHKNQEKESPHQVPSIAWIQFSINFRSQLLLSIGTTPSPVNMDDHLRFITQSEQHSDRSRWGEWSHFLCRRMNHMSSWCL